MARDQGGKLALSGVQKNKIAQFGSTFKQYLAASSRDDDHLMRKLRIVILEDLLSKQGIEQITRLKFANIIWLLRASQSLDRKGNLVDHLISDNGMPLIKSSLYDLLWSDQPVARRYNNFKKKIKGMGSGMITEILAITHPQECGFWNSTARKALILLGFEESLPIVNKNQISGAEYEKFNTTLKDIRDELSHLGVVGLDLLGVNHFFDEVWKAGWKLPDSSTSYNKE